MIDQIRIATLLSQVEALIQKRQASIDLLDDLVKNTFLEMFGDPAKNEKNWKVEPITKVVIDINSGTSYGGEDKEVLESNELGVLKISAVTKGIFDARQFKAVKKERIKKKILRVKKGMFLLSRANTIDLVAACCIVNQDYPTLFLPDKLWNLSIDEMEIEAIYLNYLLKSPNYRKLIAKKATGGHDSMLNISMKKFRTLSIPLPPKEKQTKFAKSVKKIESIKNKYETSLIELENLYNSLSQRAFRGELDLSKMKVAIPKEKLITKTVVENLKEAGEKIQQAVTTPLQELRKLEVAFRKGVEPFLKAQENLTKAILPITEKLKTQQAQQQATIQKVVQVLKQGVTFEHIWETEGIEDYEEIKTQLEEWISGEAPFMLQTFDEDKQKIIFKIR